ncbi:DUF4112 domain-containing protein [Methylicorpusculum oleiharenae]|uniref:DUF4112 domain-containing protein n=1 Tax=Methylicorpusculum oleiharenae TaxID=1338687 RepID=UPI001E4D1BC1|nr:DUF4112 domain-containing protein [Methylicorpusculum oleiharenae]MCD2451551.1 DUF4112 domain-containing protein [Methylicorpusculum oleiharenae]
MKSLPDDEKIQAEQGSDASQVLVRLTKLSSWLDDRYLIPGTDWRVGYDSILGLIPGIGDILTSSLGLYIVYKAKRLNVPNWVLAQMLWYLAVDAVVGSVPVFGDFFDMRYKAHRKNVQVLLNHLENKKYVKSGLDL